MRKQPISFTFNNTKFTVPVNYCVPADGYVNVVKHTAKLVEQDVVCLYVICNRLSREAGRMYALFYNMRTRQFDGNYTVN